MSGLLKRARDAAERCRGESIATANLLDELADRIDLLERDLTERERAASGIGGALETLRNADARHINRMPTYIKDAINQLLASDTPSSISMLKTASK